MAETPKDIWFWGELLVQCGWRGMNWEEWLEGRGTHSVRYYYHSKSEEENGTKRGGETGDRERKKGSVRERKIS